MHKDLMRLARGEASVRRHLMVCLGAAVVAGLLVLVQAELLAGVLSGRFAAAALLPLALVVVTRGLLGWIQGAFAGRTASGVKTILRFRLLKRFQEFDGIRRNSQDPKNSVNPANPTGLNDTANPSVPKKTANGTGTSDPTSAEDAPASQSPPAQAAPRSGELVTLVGRGLDALDPYLTGYLPSIAVAGIVPIAVLIRLFVADLGTAVIVLLTLPLIPVFGALVGWTTKAVTERQWYALARLGGHFLDVVRGLPTLRAFGRARYQATVIHQVADAHRAATMRTLRVAFLSSLVLELIASLSLALVAVPVGLRLLSGSLDLQTALLVLLLAPEAYIPLRAMGTKFHAAMEGVAAADEAFALLPRDHAETTEGSPAGLRRERRAAPEIITAREEVTSEIRHSGDRPAPEIRLENVTVRYPGRDDAALEDVSLVVRSGERVAIVGESGSGKSTLLHLLLGFVVPSLGRVLVDGVDLSSLDLDDWRRRLAFVPQRPHLFATSVADNIRLGSAATPEDVRTAAGAAQAAGFVAGLPDGFETVLGERGVNLSAGQRQRVALARAFCRPSAEVLLLDEPTARLDGRSEAAVIEATRRLSEGRTAIIVAHRPAMIELADRVVRIDAGKIVDDRPRHAADREDTIRAVSDEVIKGVMLERSATASVTAERGETR